LIPALINGFLTSLVFLASRRSPLTGVLAVVAILATGLSIVWLWPFRPEGVGDTRSALFGTYFAIVGITVLPGAVLALLAGRLNGRRRSVVGIASVCVSLCFGAGFIVTALAGVCQFLGDCL
jgi:hypothetical protein